MLLAARESGELYTLSGDECEIRQQGVDLPGGRHVMVGELKSTMHGPSLRLKHLVREEAGP